MSTFIGGRLVSTAGQLQTISAVPTSSDISIAGWVELFKSYGLLPGASGDYFSTPDHASLDITGDISILVRAAADDWTPASDQNLIAKWTVSGDRRSYRLFLNEVDGKIYLTTTSDGVTAVDNVSTVAPTIADGQPLWILATLDVNDGGGNRVAKFYTSSDGTFTQLGTTVTTAGVTTIFSGSSVLTVGRVQSAQEFAGKIYQAQVWSGLITVNGSGNLVTSGTTLVANFNADDFAIGATSGTDTTGKIWTKQGNALIKLQGSAYVEDLTSNAVPGTAVFVGGVAFHQNGRLYVTTDAPSSPAYIGGVAVRQDGAVHVSTSAVDAADTRLGGLAVSSSGQLRVSAV